MLQRPPPADAHGIPTRAPCPSVQFPTAHSGASLALDIERATLPPRYPVGIVAGKKRIFGWCTVGFVLFVLAVYFIGPRLFWVWQSRNTARRVPIAAAVPQPLEVFDANPATGSTIADGNYEFEVPWSDADLAKIKSGASLSAIPFTSGNTLLVATTKPTDLVTQTGTDPVPMLVKCVRAAYGPAAVSKDLAFWDAVYSTTPNKVTFFTPPDRANLLTMILMAKAIAPPTDDAAIFRVHYHGFDGFQLGDPAHPLKTAQLLLYDHDGGIEITVSHKTDPAPTPQFTQADLNRILTTLHRTKQSAKAVTVTANQVTQPRS
jgi:hypothetical protein